MSIKSRLPRLVLHFDVNETILLGDVAGGDSFEDAINKLAREVGLNQLCQPILYCMTVAQWTLGVLLPSCQIGYAQKNALLITNISERVMVIKENSLHSVDLGGDIDQCMRK